MTASTIHHIGVLVENLEEAIELWERVTDYRFDPIARYRTTNYVDKDNPDPHLSDVRIAFSKDGPPHIELMEFFGSGTHAPALGEGVHHLGFVNFEGAHEHIDRLCSFGVSANGQSLDADGRTILWFTDPADFTGVRLEFVAAEPQPIVTDDGLPLMIDAAGRPVLA